ncbi:MAG: HAMP domain-containing histidine kinase [Candidatus Obscuribacterales bacterium]|nr:HAMP domain-containing histidine kinase [Candidatus Obscuribacterales bacterium]
MFELLFVAALAALLAEAEHSAFIEAHSKEIVGKTNHVMQLFYDAGTSASDYQTEGNDPADSKKYHAAVDKIPAELNALKEVVKNDRDYLNRVKTIELRANNCLKLVSACMKFAESGDKPSALMAAHKVKPAFEKNKKQLFDEMRDLMQDQEKIIAETPVAQARWREQEKQILLAGVGFNILIAVGLALLFVRGITRRLDVMVANTVQLVKNAPLMPPLSGNDEIAKLDHSFHDMARSLKELEQIKQQFVAMISHDLRTPLTSLQMFLGMLSDGTYGELNQTGTKRVAIAERSITRLISLINDLLDFEKLQAGQFTLAMTEIELSQVIGRSIDAVNSFAEQHEVSLIAEATEITVNADGDRLIQVLVNLISNAVKFSPAKGVVTVSARKLDDSVELRVKDQGRGIPKEFQETVFERFKQVKTTDATEKGGTGLGLAICKALVEAHGGRIGVESEDGKGATFWLTVPSKSLPH